MAEVTTSDKVANIVWNGGIMDLSACLQREAGLKMRLANYYWSAMFRINRMLERCGYPFKAYVDRSPILNFGCGYNRTNATNSDILAIHKWLMGKPRPDLYLSGTLVPDKLRGHFEAVICEHVIEHIYPSQAQVLLENLLGMLKPNGMIQVSVPSISRFVRIDNDRIHINTLAINDIAYRYGHKFLHDEATVVSLLERAGFEAIVVNSYATSPYRAYLRANREPQSVYVLGKRPG